MKTIILMLILTPFFLNALSYEDTVMAFEEALENQSLAVYELKYQREQQRLQQVRESYQKVWLEAKKKKIDDMVKETNERLSRF